MNSRALALGALLGVALATVPSCGASRCGPLTCATGCCDAQGQCVKGAAAAVDSSCGTAGGVCADCTSGRLVCGAAGACVAPTDAGLDAGVTCDGCFLPGKSTCVPAQTSANSVGNCGLGGGSCATCAAGQLCSEGLCLTPGPSGHIGDACAHDWQCPSGTSCRSVTASGNATYTGGYCTHPCGVGGRDCATGSSCVTGLSGFGETDGLCLADCSSSCRTSAGYACYLTGAGDVCWVAPLPVLSPNAHVGDACTQPGDCGAWPQFGDTCLTETDRTFPGGYCTRLGCTSSNDCQAGDAGALCLERGLFTECVARCPEGGRGADAGQSSCRDGYRCVAYLKPTLDGGTEPSADGYCYPPETLAPARTGEACASDAECQVPAGAEGSCLPERLPDGGATGYTGGSCTRYACLSNADCSSTDTAVCLAFAGQASHLTQCFGSCTGPGTGRSSCRAGYACAPYAQLDGGVAATGYCAPDCHVAGAGCEAGSSCGSAGLCQ
jgi:hypothetical protein